MSEEEIEQYKNITQEFFEKQYNSIKYLGNRELRKVIENSNWNFILQIIRHLENEIFILQQEKQQLKDRINKAIENIEQLGHSEWVTFGRSILLGLLKGDKE